MRVRMLAVLLSSGLLVAACGDTPEPPAPVQVAPPPQPAVPPAGDVGSVQDGSVDLQGSPTIERIKRRGKLMVGLRSDDPTFAVRDGSGRYSGFDVEIAKILATGLGLNPQTQLTFRWIPEPLRVDTVVARSVDVQIGGVDSADPELAMAGPYVVTGTPGPQAEQFVAMRRGDDAMREQFQHILDTAVADGTWQRAYDSTLRTAGIEATPR